MSLKFKFLLVLVLLVLANIGMTKERLMTNYIQPREDFIGREDILAAIEVGFRNNNMVVLTGLEGMGKTQISRRFIKNNENNYDIVWVLNYDTDMQLQLVSLAKYLNTIYCEQKKACLINEAPKQVLGSLKSFFETTDLKWLLVLDDFNSTDEALNELLPLADASKYKRALVVSEKRLGQGLNINVSFFTPEESILLLKSYLPTVDEDRLMVLANKVQHYPQALVGIALYLSKQDIHPNTKAFDLFAASISDMHDRGETLDRVIEDTLKSYKDAEGMRLLLTYIILLGYKNIDLDLIEFLNIQKGSQDILKPAIFLNRMSMLEPRLGAVNSMESRFTMNSIIHQSIKNYIPENVLRQNINKLVQYCNSILPKDVDEINQLVKRYPSLITALTHLDNTLNEMRVMNIEVVRFKIVLLDYYTDLLIFEESKKLSEEIQAIIEESPEYSHNALGSQYLVSYYISNGFLKLVESRMREGLTDLKRALKEASTLNNHEKYEYLIYLELAQGYVHLGDVASATKAMQEVDRLYNSKANNGTFTTIDNDFILAKIYKEMGDYKKAKVFASRSKETDTTLLSRILKAEILIRSGDTRAAQEELKFNEAEEGELLSSDEIVYIKYLTIKTLIEIEMKEYALAKVSILKCNEIIEKAKKDGHKIDDEYEAQVLTASGDYYRAIKDFKKAKKDYLRAFTIYQNFMLELKNDTISLLLTKMALNMKSIGDAYNFEIYKNMHEGLMGIEHHRTKLLYSEKYKWS